MIGKKGGVDPPKNHLGLWVPLFVELHRIVNSLPRVGKQRCNVHNVRLESYVLVASDEFDMISLGLVECRDLQ
jgi:hypothetical protein